ncbi:hypothetical protein GIB23_13820 [Pseudomonas putida]|uniref:hypothetical protein n=1 Tax=Pseudomonas putida TaxID=303 RepID=UPI001A8E7E1C|nr:hypothetical protein [Pseudomonas putida]MBO0368175.1 hypothetical protein [Pseudomonas putida]
MSAKGKVTAAEARLAARNFRLRIAADLDMPAFNSANPLLPDTADDAQNQLPKALRGTNLKIDIPQFDQGDDGRRGIITLFWNGVAKAVTPQFTTPITFPVEMTLPASETGSQGQYELSYVVNILGNETSSLPLVVNIDTTAPNNNRPGEQVDLPAEVEADGITREYLNAHGKVVVTVPNTYSDAKIDDEVILMFGTSIPLATEIGRFPRPNLIDTIEFDLLEKDIKQEGDHSLFYVLADRKGNEGPHSTYRTVPVMLTPAPTDLLPPLVPLADDDLIDYADAVQGVRVVIRAYTNWFSSDRVVVTFDGNDHAPQAIGQDGTQVTLPYDLIFNGDYGSKDSRITYRIERNGKAFAEPTGKEFEVDLRMPGPDPKDPPEEVHPELKILTVKGAVSAADNVLTEADADQDVSATAAIYPNVGDDQYAQLYWNGVEATGVRVALNSASTEIAFTIPWEVVKAGGNGAAIPVSYLVGHTLNENVYHSGPREVDVSGIRIVLPEPAFQNLDPRFDVLNCPSLRVHNGALHAEIKVPGGDSRLAGKELTFIYQGWTNSSGNVAIPDTSDSFTYTPNEDEARDGFTVLLPYESALRETRQAWGSIHFTVDIDGAPAAPSERHLVDVEVQRPGGLACQIPVRRES